MVHRRLVSDVGVPQLGFADAARQQLQLHSGTGRWLVLLFALELLRQLSYLLAERSRFYYRVSSGVFGRGDRVAHQLSDYTRFRLSRVIKWLIVIAIVAIILGLVYHTSPVAGTVRGAGLDLPRAADHLVRAGDHAARGSASSSRSSGSCPGAASTCTTPAT